MSLKNITIKEEYRSLIDDMVNDFYIPVLNESVIYKRAVGFFSSSALIEISKGISALIQNGGKIQLIASPHLNEEDIEAITKGFKERENVILESLERSFSQPKNFYEERRLNLLANLVSNGQLDIKIAFLEENGTVGMYHEKLGVMSDAEHNTVAFAGSMNESKNAFSHNYEAIDVFCSWTKDNERVLSKESAFNSIWNNSEPHIKTIDFPKIAREKLNSYCTTETLDFEIDNEEQESKKNGPRFFRPPDNIDFYEYQKEAVFNWLSNGNNGIFDMATGSGKTYTGLYALSKLSEKLSSNLGVIIVAPYQHLVEQWVEDIESFGVKPIICYSAYPKWKEHFEDIINAYNASVVKNFCVVTTNSSFSLASFQKQLNRIKKDFCFVVDEAHNFGAERLSELLPVKAKYRLALSATLERHNDEEGTKKLYQYFGMVCQSFTLKEAIDKGFLTPYYYHPILVTLTRDELEKYQELTKQISKLSNTSKEEKSSLRDLLLIKRARIIAGARNKIGALLETITPYKNDNHMLIYCGATKYDKKGIDDEDDVKQITELTRELYKVHKLKVRKFTSEETKDERAEIKDMFLDGKELQAIIAIKCLDEGVNIPAIKTAFILASSTNPKEYIQRRGRVLRKAIGKNFARIYDFITIPRELSTISSTNNQDLQLEISLIRKELSRMMDFAETSRNPLDIDNLKEQLLLAYNVYNIEEGEPYDE